MLGKVSKVKNKNLLISKLYFCSWIATCWGHVGSIGFDNFMIFATHSSSLILDKEQQRQARTDGLKTNEKKVTLHWAVKTLLAERWSYYRAEALSNYKRKAVCQHLKCTSDCDNTLYLRDTNMPDWSSSFNCLSGWLGVAAMVLRRYKSFVILQ